MNFPNIMNFKKDYSILDERFGLIFLIGICIIILFSSITYSNIAWSALGATIGCILVIGSAGFRLFSFVTMVGLLHLFFFPIAVFANLLLEYPAVREDLWESAGLAMLGCAVGCIGLVFGSMLSRLVNIKYKSFSDTNLSTPLFLNIILFLLVPVPALVMYYLGIYFHIAVTGDFAFDKNIYLNLLGIINWIGYTGIFLQLRRYYMKKTMIDAVIFIAMVIFAILIFLPSGSRSSAILFIPLLLVYYIILERRYYMKLIMLAISAVLLIIIIITAEIYRDSTGRLELTSTETVSIMESSFITGFEDKDKTIYLLIGRFSDFSAVGRIIDYTPKNFPYRGLEGVEDWWQMFVPGFLRPNVNLSTDGAQQTLKYEVTPADTTSTPVMIIGDLYSRGGWIGILIGMIIIGFTLGVIDRSLLYGRNVFSLIFFVIYGGRHVFPIHTASLLNVFVTLTRDLFLTIILSDLLSRLVAYCANKRLILSFHKADN